MLKRYINYLLLLILGVNLVATPTVALAQAPTDAQLVVSKNQASKLNKTLDYVKMSGRTAQDMSQAITAIQVTPNQIKDGHRTKVHVTFDAQQGRLQTGDQMTVHWANTGTVYGSGFEKTVPVSIGGTVVGTLTVGSKQATLVFNEQINDLDSVSGWFEFELAGRNVANTTQNNTGALTIYGGSKSANVMITKPAAGMSSETFYYKAGDMLPSNTDQVRWFLNINNGRKYTTEQIKVTDQIQPGQTLNLASFDINVIDYNNQTKAFRGIDAIQHFEAAYPGATIQVDRTSGQLTITIPAKYAQWTRFYILYCTDIEDYCQPVFKNKSQASYHEYNQAPVVGIESDAAVNNANADGSVQGKNQTHFTVEKVWDDEYDQDGLRPNRIQVQLYADGIEKGTPVTLTAAQNWRYTWPGLVASRDGKVVQYTVKELTPVPGYTTTSNVVSQQQAVLTNTHHVMTTTVSGTKTWSDQANQDGKRPKQITVNLCANGQKIQSQTVTAQDDWQYQFKALPVYQNGQKMHYTITEVPVPAYTTEVNGYNLINHYSPLATKLKVTKVWQDQANQDGQRPSQIQVQLYANQQRQGSPVILSSQSDWTYEWADLAANQQGKPVDYTVKEVTKVPGYQSTITAKSADEVIITNTHQVKTRTIAGTKTWHDQDNQDGLRPTKITVNLLANGQKIQSQTVTAEDNWQYQFKALPVNQNGHQIHYTITEEPVTGYTTKVTGFDLENTHKVGTTAIAGTKTWHDQDNQDGLRPTKITVNLLANGQKIQSQTVTAQDNWQYQFKALPVNQNGRQIHYTTTEEPVTGYTTKVTGFDLENTHKVGTTAIAGTKTWHDQDNQDGLRPAKITVNLLANGQKVQSQTVTAQDNWQYQFKALPVNQNGQKIDYQITEEPVIGYTTKVTGFNLINQHTPSVSSLKVTKVWADNDDQDGLRPQHIQVQLYANNRKQGAPITLSHRQQWSYEWHHLAARKQGQLVRYSVKEVTQVLGYQATITTPNKQHVVLTNTHQPIMTVIKGTKTWHDQDNQDGLRPTKIIVSLLANGQKIQSQTVTAEDNWQYQFKAFPVNQNGQKIDYQITEEPVSGYTTKVTGFDLENTHETMTRAISGRKTWHDQDNQDGLRPAKITVNLLANGQKIQSQTVTAEDNWQYQFKALPVNQNGQKIDYQITEEPVTGYTTKVTGFNLENTHEIGITAIAGRKTWRDQDNQDGVRPTKITVNLLADGQKIQSQTVTAEDDWQYQFKALPVNQNGQKIDYQITEEPVSGYTTKVTGFDLENTHETMTRAISGRKTWLDQNDQAGQRPTQITVNLFADGQYLQSQSVTAATDWHYRFDHLPVKHNGQVIHYQLTEDPVAGYLGTVKGYQLENRYVPIILPPVIPSDKPKKSVPAPNQPIIKQPMANVIIKQPVQSKPKKDVKPHLAYLPQTGVQPELGWQLVGLGLVGFVLYRPMKRRRKV